MTPTQAEPGRPCGAAWPTSPREAHVPAGPSTPVSTHQEVTP